MGKEYFKGDAEEGRAYSPAVKVSGGTTVYLAGVGMATDEDGNSLAGNFEAQVRASFERIRQNLARAGGVLDDIVTMTVFVTDMRHGTPFTQLRKEYFNQGFPCSALIGISAWYRGRPAA